MSDDMNPMSCLQLLWEPLTTKEDVFRGLPNVRQNHIVLPESFPKGKIHEMVQLRTYRVPWTPSCPEELPCTARLHPTFIQEPSFLSILNKHPCSSSHTRGCFSCLHLTPSSSGNLSPMSSPCPAVLPSSPLFFSLFLLSLLLSLNPTLLLFNVYRFFSQAPNTKKLTDSFGGRSYFA